MAAIARSIALGLALFIGCCTANAQQSRAVREQVGHVASALSAGHPQEAMDSFDKSFRGYDQLRGYFAGLTDANTVINEIDITDEEIGNREATLTVHWTLTLNDLVTGLTKSRAQDLTVKLVMKKYDWRIIDIAPFEFFNPDSK